MAHSSHDTHTQATPAAIDTAQHGWHYFTKAMFWGGLVTALTVALVIFIIT